MEKLGHTDVICYKNFCEWNGATDNTCLRRYIIVGDGGCCESIQLIVDSSPAKEGYFKCPVCEEVIKCPHSNKEK